MPVLVAMDVNLLLTGGLIILAWVVIRLLLRPQRSPHRYESPLKQSRDPGHMLDAPAEIGRWEVQMHDTARNLMGELNTKIAIVEQLVRDANAAAERLEKALEESRRAN